MKLESLTLAESVVDIHHPDDADIKISVRTRHPQSREYNAARVELSKDDDQTLAAVVAEAATVEVIGIDDFDNSPESIRNFLRDPRFFWVAAEIARPYIEQKKSSTKD